MRTWQNVMAAVVPDDNPTYRMTIYSLAPHGPGFTPNVLSYLQYVRDAALLRRVSVNTDYESEYLRDLDAWTTQLSQLIPNDLAPDAIALAPSSRTLGVPYRAAISARFPSAVDLSQHFTKTDDTKAGSLKTFAEVLKGITYAGPPQPSLGSLLIVDDVLESGRTVASMVNRLLVARMPPTSTITVAVPLRVFAACETMR